MLNKSVARRYAEAFFSLAQEQGKIDEFEKDLETVVKILNETEYLKEYLGHLLIQPQAKKDVMTKLLAEKVSQNTLNFIHLIVDKRREKYIEIITEEYKNMADESRNITKAELVAAREVPEEYIKDLAEKLSKATGKTIKITQKVEPALLGGVKIRIGDQVIDGTVAKKLETLREKLRQAKIS
ncbi:F0F1 ATP synthase subunit delta [Thermosyntropha sp.]|uniref:F0F1 ATP synthase subunit delta n=1 Tax=Thermosyntropha sp. TaxID=2740820 RepID=UPI0025ED04EC|nr:F0F1 ATP synthase subunit delta [Thermosyntropha sp.]MBO8157978.1 F0F1 ATP synthase subunit delta [Thermosyntropha sp.]